MNNSRRRLQIVEASCSFAFVSALFKPDFTRSMDNVFLLSRGTNLLSHRNCLSVHHSKVIHTVEKNSPSQICYGRTFTVHPLYDCDVPVLS